MAPRRRRAGRRPLQNRGLVRPVLSAVSATPRHNSHSVPAGARHAPNGLTPHALPSSAHAPGLDRSTRAAGASACFLEHSHVSGSSTRGHCVSSLPSAARARAASRAAAAIVPGASAGADGGSRGWPRPSLPVRNESRVQKKARRGRCDAVARRRRPRNAAARQVAPEPPWSFAHDDDPGPAPSMPSCSAAEHRERRRRGTRNYLGLVGHIVCDSVASRDPIARYAACRAPGEITHDAGHVIPDPTQRRHRGAQRAIQVALPDMALRPSIRERDNARAPASRQSAQPQRRGRAILQVITMTSGTEYGQQSLHAPIGVSAGDWMRDRSRTSADVSGDPSSRAPAPRERAPACCGFSLSRLRPRFQGYAAPRGTPASRCYRYHSRPGCLHGLQLAAGLGAPVTSSTRGISLSAPSPPPDTQMTQACAPDRTTGPGAARGAVIGTRAIRSSRPRATACTASARTAPDDGAPRYGAAPCNRALRLIQQGETPQPSGRRRSDLRS